MIFYVSFCLEIDDQYEVFFPRLSTIKFLFVRNKQMKLGLYKGNAFIITSVLENDMKDRVV